VLFLQVRNLKRAKISNFRVSEAACQQKRIQISSFSGVHVYDHSPAHHLEVFDSREYTGCNYCM
jgi:hypothetical protein